MAVNTGSTFEVGVQNADFLTAKLTGNLSQRHRFMPSFSGWPSSNNILAAQTSTNLLAAV
jgi:hypothetical protein